MVGTIWNTTWHFLFFSRGARVYTTLTRPIWMGNRNKQSVLCAVMQVLISWTGSISAQTVERSPRYGTNVGCVHVVGIYGGLCFDRCTGREGGVDRSRNINRR